MSDGQMDQIIYGVWTLTYDSELMGVYLHEDDAKNHAAHAGRSMYVVPHRLLDSFHGVHPNGWSITMGDDGDLP